MAAARSVGERWVVDHRASSNSGWRVWSPDATRLRSSASTSPGSGDQDRAEGLVTVSERLGRQLDATSQMPQVVVSQHGGLPFRCDENWPRLLARREALRLNQNARAHQLALPGSARRGKSSWCLQTKEASNETVTEPAETRP